ncbi:MAG: iron ABC transporter permease [Alkaliphilus sp.]|nr:iron ABC transporter permease [bacterium AH-315-G05]MBN4074390.1 iron ABC transporter permease [bacterium AH-315-E09]PHS31557.1 MAG: iron ABC transporter permease [Alkaliphilus sp.]
MTSQSAKDAQIEIRKRLAKRIGIFIAEISLLVVLAVISLRFGSVRFSTGEIINALIDGSDSTIRIIVMHIRMPRTALAILVGASLATSGALLQAVLRNPLASPGLIGVISGASLSAITIMLVFPALTALVPFAAFIGGLVATLLVFTLAWKKGMSTIRIILAGVAVNAMLGGGTSLLSVLYSDRIQGIIMWLNGTLAGKSWDQVKLLWPYVAVGLLVALLSVNVANSLQLGDEAAKNLGVRLNLARTVLCATAAFLAGISVAVVGIIGFIGLIVPHVSRLLVGSDYRFMLPSSAILGAVLLVSADIVARTVFSPIELPVGVIMAVIGGPFFLYLLRKVRGYGQ